MQTSKFTTKLDALGQTLSLLRTYDLDPLVCALERSRDRPVIAIGSGGSHIVASFFSRCRETLAHGVTLVQTPMQLVLDMSSLRDFDVWLFSASADNADLAAAAQAASDRGCNRIIVCTRNSAGSVADWVSQKGGDVVTVPTADTKDGFLATHSLLASVAALLAASDALCGGTQRAVALINAVQQHLEQSRRPDVRQKLREAFSEITADTTLVVLADPRLHATSLLLETSIWEAALCTVQTTDVRNFAHGRHTWLYHRSPQTFVLSLTGEGSRDVWNSADLHLPKSIPVACSDYGECGRLANTTAIIDGLSWIEAIGDTVGIDPGKPGVGEFGRALYDDPILLSVAEVLPSQVRHKLSPATLADETGQTAQFVLSAFEDKVSTLCDAEYCGLVMDYDGTMVTTEGRREPPHPEIIDELLRLHREGIAIAFASGRGKSLGKAIRDAFPSDVAAEFLVGYYNGGYLRTADVDIALDRPDRDPVIGEIESWLDDRSDLYEHGAIDFGALQVEIDVAKLRHPYHFQEALKHCPAINDGRARIVSSAHSFDIIPKASSKLRVVEALERNARPEQAVMSIGDSGMTGGNDHALLARQFGISVNAACPDLAGCWSLFGTLMTGPDALLIILRAMLPTKTGGIRLNRNALCLDKIPWKWYET